MLADNVPIHRLVAGLAGRINHLDRSGNVAEMEFELPTRGDEAAPAPAIITACAGS